MKTEERKREDRMLLRDFFSADVSVDEFVKLRGLTPVKLSHEEIEKDLISQAIQKGYVKGCKVKCFEGWHDIDGDRWMNNTVAYQLERDGTLWIEGIHFHGLCIFKDGNWAEFIKEDSDSIKNIRADMKELRVKIKKLKKDYKDLLKELD